jgi:hypothetical protein
MGHKSIETTLRYAHLAEPHLRDAVEQLTVKQTDTRTSTEQKSAFKTQKVKSA